jgi:hypothetical protein
MDLNDLLVWQKWSQRYLELMKQLEDHLAQKPGTTVLVGNTTPDINVNPVYVRPTWPPLTDTPAWPNSYPPVVFTCNVCGRESSGVDLYCCMRADCPSSVTCINGGPGGLGSHTGWVETWEGVGMSDKCSVTYTEEPNNWSHLDK